MKRTYNSENRKRQAVETKQRILDAAKKLFQSKGFEPVTITMLAEEAKVSAPTVYALFKSKRGVLRALIDEALPPAEFEALVEAVRHEPSPKKRLMISAQMARRIYDAERSQSHLFRGAAVLAPEFKDLEKEREERRYHRQEESVMMIAEQKALKKGLNVTQARDIMWAFTGRDMYRMFVIERGWTSQQYELWLGQLLIDALLEEES